jgi:FMN phosphatase YigB (HAD superfamily)
MEGLVTPMSKLPAEPRTYIIVDLDGTLCNSAHRDHLAVAKEWDQFHSLLTEDEPHKDVMKLVNVLNLGLWPHMDLEVVALTGRNEKYRKLTEQWLLKHNIATDHLLMRPDHDWRSDHELKPKMLVDFITGLDPDQVWSQEHIDAARAQVWFILEDRDKVVEAWRNLGFRCWQTQPGGY